MGIAWWNDEFSDSDYGATIDFGDGEGCWDYGSPDGFEQYGTDGFGCEPGYGDGSGQGIYCLGFADGFGHGFDLGYGLGNGDGSGSSTLDDDEWS